MSYGRISINIGSEHLVSNFVSSFPLFFCCSFVHFQRTVCIGVLMFVPHVVLFLCWTRFKERMTIVVSEQFFYCQKNSWKRSAHFWKAINPGFSVLFSWGKKSANHCSILFNFTYFRWDSHHVCISNGIRYISTTEWN